MQNRQIEALQENIYFDMILRNPLVLEFYEQLHNEFKEKLFQQKLKKDSNIKKDDINDNDAAEMVHEYLSNINNFNDINTKMAVLEKQMAEQEHEHYKMYQDHVIEELNGENKNALLDSLYEEENTKKTLQSINRSVKKNKEIENLEDKTKIDPYSKACNNILFSKQVRDEIEETLDKQSNIKIKKVRTFLGWNAGYRKKVTSDLLKILVHNKSHIVKNSLDIQKNRVLKSENKEKSSTAFNILVKLKRSLLRIFRLESKETIEDQAKKSFEELEQHHNQNKENAKDEIDNYKKDEILALQETFKEKKKSIKEINSKTKKLEKDLVDTNKVLVTNEMEENNVIGSYKIKKEGDLLVNPTKDKMVIDANLRVNDELIRKKEEIKKEHNENKAAIKKQVEQEHRLLISKKKIEINSKVALIFKNDKIKANDITSSLFAKIESTQQKNQKHFNDKCLDINDNNGKLSLKDGGIYLGNNAAKKIIEDNNKEITKDIEAIDRNMSDILKSQETHENNAEHIKKSITAAKDKIDETVKKLGLKNNAIAKVNSLLSFMDNDSDDQYAPFEQINSNKYSISLIENSIPKFSIKKIESNPDKSVKKIHYSMLSDTSKHTEKIDEYYKNTITAIEETHKNNQTEIKDQVINQHQLLIESKKNELKQRIKPAVGNDDIQAEQAINLLFARIDSIQKKHEQEFLTGKCQDLNNNDGELSLKEGGSCLSDKNTKTIKDENNLEIETELNAINENVKSIINNQERHNRNTDSVKQVITHTNNKIDLTVSSLGLNNGPVDKIGGLISLIDNNSEDEYALVKEINLNKSSISKTINNIEEFSITKIDSNNDGSVKKIHYAMLTDDKRDDHIADIDKSYEDTINLIAANHNSNKQVLKNTISNYSLSEENSLKSTFPSELNTVATITQARQTNLSEVNACEISKTGSGAKSKVTLENGEYLSNKKTEDKLNKGKQEITNKLSLAKKAIKNKHDINKDRILDKADELSVKLKDLERNFPKDSDREVLKKIEKRIMEQVNDANQSIVKTNNQNGQLSLNGTYLSDNEYQKREKILNCIDDYISLLQIEKTEEDIKNIKDSIENKNKSTKSGLHQTKIHQTDSILRTQDRWYGIDNENWSSENKDFTAKKEGANSHKLALRRIIEEDSTLEFNKKAISYNPKQYIKIDSKKDPYQGINPYKSELNKEKNRLSSLERRFDDRIKQEESGVHIQVMIKKCRTQKQDLVSKKRLDVKYNDNGRKITRTKTYIDLHEDEWDTCISKFKARQKDKKDSKQQYIDEVEKTAFITGNAAFIAANIDRDIAIQEDKRKDAIKKLKKEYKRFAKEFQPLNDKEEYTYYSNEINLCLNELKFSDVSENGDNSSNDDAENPAVAFSAQTTANINKEILEKRNDDFEEITTKYNDLYGKRFYIPNGKVKLDIYPKILNKANESDIEQLPILMRNREDGLAKRSKELTDLINSKQNEIKPLQSKKRRIIFESALDNLLINGLNQSAKSAKSSAKSLKSDLMGLNISLKTQQRRNLSDLQRDSDLLQQKTAAFKQRLMNEYDRFSKERPGEKFVMPNEAVEEIRQLKDLQKSIDERKAGVDKAHESKNNRFWAERTTNNHLDFSTLRSNAFIREELTRMENKLKTFTYLLEEYDAESKTNNTRKDLEKRVDKLNMGGSGKIDKLKQKVNKYERRKTSSSKNTKITNEMMEIQQEYEEIQQKMSHFQDAMSDLNHPTPQMQKVDNKNDGVQQYTYRIQKISPLNNPYQKMASSKQVNTNDGVVKKVTKPRVRHQSYDAGMDLDAHHTNGNKSLMNLSTPSMDGDNNDIKPEKTLNVPVRHATMIT